MVDCKMMYITNFLKFESFAKTQLSALHVYWTLKRKTPYTRALYKMILDFHHFGLNDTKRNDADNDAMKICISYLVHPEERAMFGGDNDDENWLRDKYEAFFIADKYLINVIDPFLNSKLVAKYGEMNKRWISAIIYYYICLGKNGTPKDIGITSDDYRAFFCNIAYRFIRTQAECGRGSMRIMECSSVVIEDDDEEEISPMSKRQKLVHIVDEREMFSMRICNSDVIII